MLIKWAVGGLAVGALVAVISLLTLNLHLQKKAVTSLQEDLVLMTESNKQLSLSLLATRELVSKVRQEQLDFEKSATSVRASVNKNKRELEALKGREEVVLKKLSLIELRINKSFTKSQNDLACITGDATLCTQN